MYNFNKFSLILAIIFITLFNLPANAELQFPDRVDRRVNDWGNVLTEDQEQILENKLREFEMQTSNQIIIATFPSLVGENLEDVSIRIAEVWDVGQEDKDNGVILLVFVEDRKLRIEVGYGLEAVLTDILSDQIVRNEIVPEFRKGNYYEGIKAGTNAIIAAIGGTYKPSNKTNSTGTFRSFLEFIFIIFIIIIIWRFRHGSGSGGFYVSSGSSSWSSGSSSGFGGGFSGGGGSFGGGGASGSW